MWPYFYDFMIWKGKIREVKKTNQEVRKWGRSFEMKRTKRFFLRGFFTPLLRSWSVRHMECVSVYWNNLSYFQFFAPRPRWWFPLKGSFFSILLRRKLLQSYFLYLRKELKTWKIQWFQASFFSRFPEKNLSLKSWILSSERWLWSTF